MAKNEDSLGLEIGGNYLGTRPHLLGYQELPHTYFPLTRLQIRNQASEYAGSNERQQAAEAALQEADRLGQAALEEEDFSRRLTIGSVVRPRNNTLAGYQAMLRTSGREWNVQFSPQEYGSFDEIVLKAAGLDDNGKPNSAMFNPNHPLYEEFAPLRRNLAVLRNYIMCQMFPDGEFIPNVKTHDGEEDYSRYQMLNEMAERLGKKLAEGGEVKPTFSQALKNMMKLQPVGVPSLSKFASDANIPDKGAAVMYDFLFNLRTDKDYRDVMKPTEETPFSSANLATSSRALRMEAVADAYEHNVMVQLRVPDAPENLSPADRNTSVEIARDILERLRKLLASTADRSQLSQFTDDREEEGLRFLKVADSFREAVARIKDIDPGMIQNNRAFGEAFEALEQIGYRMKGETATALSNDQEPAAAEAMKKEMEKTPEQYKTAASTETLLAKVDSGLKEAARLQQRIADKIAMREADRALRRGAQNKTSRDALSRAQRSVRKSLETQLKGLDDKMAGATLTAANNEEALKYARQLEEQRAAAAQANPSDTSRGR